MSRTAGDAAVEELRMTQIRSIATQPRRPGELGVHSVDHFNFAVPDLKQAQTFYHYSYI